MPEIVDLHSAEGAPDEAPINVGKVMAAVRKLKEQRANDPLAQVDQLVEISDRKQFLASQLGANPRNVQELENIYAAIAAVGQDGVLVVAEELQVEHVAIRR